MYIKTPIKLQNVTKDKLYSLWGNIIQRCTNPNEPKYKTYGARGITICERWHKGEGEYTGFECFHADVGERPEDYQLDRIDNSKGYYPENCRWASRIENNNNRDNNVRLEYKGRIETISNIAREEEIDRDLLYDRIKYQGMSLEEALDKRKKGDVLEIEGVSKYLSEWSEETGLKEALILERIRKNYKGKDIIRPSEANETIMIDIEGVSKSAKEWSEETGISMYTIKWRYNSGKRGVGLIKEVDKKPVETYEINGVSKTAGEWAKVAGIDARVFRRRYKKLGWRGDDLLKPARKMKAKTKSK